MIWNSQHRSNTYVLILIDGEATSQTLSWYAVLKMHWQRSNETSGKWFLYSWNLSWIWLCSGRFSFRAFASLSIKELIWNSALRKYQTNATVRCPTGRLNLILRIFHFAQWRWEAKLWIWSEYYKNIKDHIYCIGEIDHAVATFSECPIECSTITYNKHIIFDGPHEHNIGLF